MGLRGRNMKEQLELTSMVFEPCINCSLLVVGSGESAIICWHLGRFTCGRSSRWSPCFRLSLPGCCTRVLSIVLALRVPVLAASWFSWLCWLVAYLLACSSWGVGQWWWSIPLRGILQCPQWFCFCLRPEPSNLLLSFGVAWNFRSTICLDLVIMFQIALTVLIAVEIAVHLIARPMDWGGLWIPGMRGCFCEHYCYLLVLLCSACLLSAALLVVPWLVSVLAGSQCCALASGCRSHYLSWSE